MTAPRKRGRPPGSTDPNARRRRIEVRVTEQEGRRIEDHASRSSLTVSEYMRRMALRRK